MANIERLFSDGRRVLLMIILGLVFEIPILNFFSYGYLIRIANKKYSFGKKSSTFKYGFFLWLIIVIWSIPYIVFSFLAFGGATPSVVFFLFMPEIANLIYVALFLVFAVLLYYMLISITISYAKHKKFSAGFNFKEIFKTAFSVKYLFWILGMFLISAISGLLRTTLPLYLSPFIISIVFYFIVVIFLNKISS